MCIRDSFVHNFLRKILKSQRARVISKLMSKRCFHVKNRDSNLPMIFTGARGAQELAGSSAGKQTGRPINAAGFSEPRLRPLISAFGRDRCWSTGPPVSYTHLRAHETPEHLVC